MLTQRLAGAVVAATTVAGFVIDLSAQHWNLSSNNATVAGRVPSHAHLDLLAAGVIGEPLYGTNDIESLWVQRLNWTYSTRLGDLTTEEDTATWLVFDGLDTFAYIELCDQPVGNADNQFRQWYFDVSSIVQSFNATDATLSVNFGPASKIVAAIAEHGDPLLNTIDGGPAEEFCCKEYMRKQQSDFGWDWAPQIGPARIWQPARLVQLDHTATAPVYIRNTLVDIYRNGQMNNIPPDQSQPFVFNVSIDFIGSLPNGSSLQLTLTDAEDTPIVDSRTLEDISASDETITGSIAIDPDLVELWWPVGLGNQNLYQATVDIVSNGGPIATVKKTVGFRTIVLNLLNITDSQLAAGVQPGSNWHFEINGHEFYAKGSNLVPPDAFWPRVNETKIQNLFDAVVTGNQNMLRVWSSGVYLPDWIYDMADKMGILLWSEFEFSDLEYPTDSSNIDEYIAEATYQVRRVNHHPSLALWAGGNELEAIILYYFFDAKNPSQIQRMYEEIQQITLIQAVYANSRSISYIPSSTYNGFLSLNFSSDMPQLPRYQNTSGPDYLYANTDTYNYDANQAFNASSYPIGRFATEFGFQSMPSVYSWQNSVPSDQLSLFSDMVIHRNRHYVGGNTTREQSIVGIEQMITGVEAWYPVPNMTDPVANFSCWCWTTQVFRADYYTSELAFYRRGAGLPSRNMGSLYWQLEDLWTAPTWASIEADGRWKVLMYRTKDIYQPVVAHSFFNTSTRVLEVWAMSDLWSTVNGTMKLSWMDWNGTAVPSPENSTDSIPFTIGPINSTLSYKASVATHSVNFMQTNPTELVNVVLKVEISAIGQPPNSATQHTYKHTSYFHPVSLHEAKLQDPGLILTSSGRGDGVHYEFTVTTSTGVAAWVWLDHPLGVQGAFSDNAFWLIRGERKTVEFAVKNDWTEGAWVDAVTVRSMWNNTLSV